MDIYEVIVKDKQDITEVLNFINDMKRMLGLDWIQPEGIHGNIIYCKFTPQFAASVATHDAVVSTRIAL